MVKRALKPMSRYVTEPIPSKRQKGYVLLLVAVFLTLLTATSIHFIDEVDEYTTVSGITRDSSASMMIAESALEHLRGQFLAGISQCNNAPACSNATPNDICETINLKNQQSAPDDCLEPYMFYVNDGGVGTGITQTQPSLLQIVANGEASSINAAQNSHNIIPNFPVGANNPPNIPEGRLTINDLFINANTTPKLYVLNANGRLTASLAANWTAESSLDKGAAWIEVVRNPNDPNNAVDLVVQAVGQSGDSKSYVQRYIGTFYPTNILGGGLSVLTEASPISRTP